MESQGNIISRSTQEGQWIHAFNGCKSLIELLLHDGLRSIGEGACLCPTSTSHCLSQALVIRHLVIAQH